jgi:hypothetical protein
VVFITPIAFQRISYRTWIIFAATNFAILPLVYFFYPETAFRSLEEVDVIFQLADDAPGNPWITAVKISQSEPLWFGKKDPEKRLNFNYGNSSWHKRLVDSVLSGNSGSGTDGSGSQEKRPWSNGDSPDSGETAVSSATRGRKRPEESPVDPRLHASPPLSPTMTMTTTITSEYEKKRPRKKLQKRNSQASSVGSCMSNLQAPPPLPTHQPGIPHHQRTRSTSSDSIHSIRPGRWGEDLAPAPLSVHSGHDSRSSSLAREQVRGRPSSRMSQRSVSNNALNRIVNPDLLNQQRLRTVSMSSFHAQSTDQDRERDGIDYPGILTTEERGRGSSGIVRTASERETYLPDGVYEVVEGRVRQISAGPSRPASGASSRRYSARDAGFAR